MHDLGVVQELIERLQGGPEDVVEVRMRAGASFSLEAMQQAWEMLVPGTALEGARLVVERSIDVHRCAACGEHWTVQPEDVTGHMVLCPSCGAVCPLSDGARVEVIAVRTAGTRVVTPEETGAWVTSEPGR